MVSEFLIAHAWDKNRLANLETENEIDWKSISFSVLCVVITLARGVPRLPAFALLASAGRIRKV